MSVEQSYQSSANTPSTNPIVISLENMKTKLTSAMQDEIELVLTRLRRKIFETLEVEDDLDIDLEGFAKTTIKKVFKNEEYIESEKELEKSVKEYKGEKKLKRDPDAPKGAKNAFIFFCADNRDEIKEENPSLSIKEISKKLGEMWKEVDSELKVEYQEKAKQDKERFERELEDYVPKEGFKNPKDKKKSKPKSNSPKRARSAYIFFCQDKRESVASSGLKNTDVLKKLGEMWKDLDDKKKKKYVKMAEQDKERYDEEMKNYNPPSSEKNENEKKKKKSKKSGKKRALSGYMLFCKDAREDVKEENPDMKLSEITKILGQMWRDLSEKKKKKYNTKAAELKKELEEENKDNDEIEDEQDEKEDEIEEDDE